MKFNRDTEGKIIDANEDGTEIHPYITVLAGIEAQDRFIPPVVPRLTSVGWDTVKSALKFAIEKTITDNEQLISMPAVSSVGIEAAPEDSLPEIAASELQPTSPGRKPQKPIYKSA